jgi:membrane-associated protein
MSKIIWAMIILPGLLALFGAWRARRARVSTQARV